MADLENATPDSGAGASPQLALPPADSGNIQPTGEATGQSATGAESFLPKGVDVNTLPPALRTELDRINKEMVRGFTAKTEELAAKSKQYDGYEGFKEKAELYDQFSTQEAFVSQWNDYVNKLNTAQQTGNQAQENVLEKKLQQLEQKFQQTEALEFINAWALATNEKGERVRPDFEALENLQFPDVKSPQGEPINLLSVAVQLAQGRTPEEKLNNGYAVAKKFHDSIFEAGKKAAFTKVQSRVRNGSEPPTVTTTGDEVVVKSAKDITAREALQAARQGKRIIVQE